MEIIAKTFSGLEEVLKNEIEKIGGEKIKILRRSVSFKGDKKILYRANYKLRTALRILMPLFEFNFSNINDFYAQLYDFQWEKFFDVKQTIAVDPVVSSKTFKNTHFAALKAKDAIVDSFKSKTGKRPNVDTKYPDIKINLYVNGKYANVSIDTSGAPLFKRGYRVKQGTAPLNEVLAAGLIYLSEWDTNQEFLDFMCGSGTLPIEALMIGYNIPPQFKRKKFGFMNLKNYDQKLWQEVIDEENEKQTYKKISVFASDVSRKAIDIAAENIANAGFSTYINLRVSSFDKLHFNEPKHIIFNPPYGKRIGNKGAEMDEFYKHIGDTLKHNFPESTAWMFTGNLQALKRLGLRTSKKIIIYNGPIESRFVKYEIF